MTSPELANNILSGKYFDSMPIPENSKLYAIVDGAKLKSLYVDLQHHNPEYKILYEGALADHFEEAAPYIITLDPKVNFTHSLINKGLYEDCMILLHSTNDINTLAKHFSDYTVVYIDHLDQNALYAFYDPRVAGFHFDNLSLKEITAFLKPVSCVSFSTTKRPGLLSCFYSVDNERGWVQFERKLDSSRAGA